MQGDIRRHASISPCGLYRYRLTRNWGAGAMMPFIMLNPSTADAELDDPTIRRCMGFARREGAGGIAVVNLFALRATNPDRLREERFPFGPKNRDALWEVAIVSAETQTPVVAAWGAGGTVHGGDNLCIKIMQAEGAILRCLGKTRGGHPRHPLYVRGDQPLEVFP